MVHGARVRRVQDRLLDRLLALNLDLDVEVAFRNFHSGGAVAIDAHRAKVRHVNVFTGLDDGSQQVVGGVDVVVHCVALGAGALHGVRRSALFGEVHHGVGTLGGEELEESVVVLRHVEVTELDGLTGDLVPGGDALFDGDDRSQRLSA